MPRNLIIFSLFFLAGVLNISLLTVLTPGNWAPDVVLMILIILLTRTSYESLWKWAIVAGVIVDIISYNPIGLSPFCYLVILYGFSFIAKRFFVFDKKGSFLVSLALAAAATIAHHLMASSVFFVSELVSQGNRIRLFSLFDPAIIIPKITAGIMVLIVFYWPINRIKELFSYRDNKSLIK